MNCPKCSAGYSAGDSFCMSCGNDLRAAAAAPRKTSGQGRSDRAGGTVLDHPALASIAASHACSALSPLTLYRGDGEQPAVSDLAVDPGFLELILRPRRTCCLTEISRDALRRDMLLAANAAFCAWSEDAEAVSLSREEGPSLFLERVKARLSEALTKTSALHAELPRVQVKVLKAVHMLSESLASLNRAAAFVSPDQLSGLLGDRAEWEDGLAGLVQAGFVTRSSGEDPLFMLSTKGEETASVLSGYDAYFLLESITEGAASFPSLQFAARRGCLYLVTGKKAGGGLVVRALERDAVRSLVDWAWVSTASSA